MSTQTKLEYLDEIAREAWAGNYARVGALSQGETLYVAHGSSAPAEIGPQNESM